MGLLDTAILPPSVEWLLFDAVGTLIYADPPVALVYAEIAGRFGSRLEKAEIQTRFRRAFATHAVGGGTTSEAYERQRWQRIVGQVIDDVAADRFSELFEALWNHFSRPESWKLFDDVVPTLESLASSGLKLGIASNFDERLLRIVAGHRALAVFEPIFVSSALGHCKPSVDFFRTIERRLGTRPEQMALLGDDPVNDIQGASEAGWTAIAVERG